MQTTSSSLSSSRILLFAPLLLGLGLGASLVLDALWYGLRRENLPGIEPVRTPFNVELRGSENQELLNREDVAKLVAAAVPGADVITVRDIEADVEVGGQPAGAATIALVSDNALDMLGVKMVRGRIPNPESSGPQRQLVMSNSFAERLEAFDRDESGLIALKSRGVVASNSVGFQSVGVTEDSLTGLTYQRPIDLWVGEREWPNWLLSGDVPERILDVMFPVETVLIFPQETMTSEALAGRLQSASEQIGHSVSVTVVEGTARDPSATPRIQAQTLVHSTLAISMLAICTVGSLFLWALVLVRDYRELQIRAMLGETLSVSRTRLGARSIAIISVGVAVSVVLALVVLRVLATIEPYVNFALGAWFLRLGEFFGVAMRSILVPVVLLIVQFLLAEVVLRRVHQRRLHAGAAARTPLSSLVALSASVSVVACSIAATAYLGQYKMKTRDFGFDTANLVQVAVVRSDRQLIDAAFDASPASIVVEDLRDRVRLLDSGAEVSVSSVHPLQKLTTIEYAMNDDPPDRRSLGSVVRIDAGFFSTFGIPSPETLVRQEPILPPNGVLIDEAFLRSHADADGRLGSFRLYDVNGFRDPVVSVAGIVRSIFYDGATGDAVPSIFRAMTRRGDIRWVWIRTSIARPMNDIQKLVEDCMKAHGIAFERVEARTFSDALQERLLVQLTERNTALTASMLLVALSVVTTFALFAFAGRSRAKEFALRMAVGATPVRAMLGLMRGATWMPLLGLCVGWIVAASTMLPIVELLGISRLELALAILGASVVTVTLVLVGLILTARRVSRASLRDTLVEA
mgnify:CR=1 FL=1